MKLTKLMRLEISSAILKHQFAAERATIESAKFELADTFYCAKYPAEQRALMATLPAGWLPTSGSMTVNVAGCRVHLTFRAAMLFGYKDDREYVVMNVPAGSALADQWEAIRGKQTDLESAREAAGLDVMAILNGCSTVAAALARWPEAASFINAVAERHAPPANTLPAVNMPEINARLGLPPAQVAA